tara:strand:- start:92 stop:1615 length:1524 start_codon:yes stop_codon:yes gene_type:complete
MEYYNGTEWKIVDAPPVVSSITPANMPSIPDGGSATSSVSFTITGSGFAAGATVTFIPTSGTNVNANSVTVNSNTNITAVVNDRSTIAEANDPYSIKVQNLSGLSAQLGDGLQVNSSPAFSVAAGSLGSFLDGTSVGTIACGATDVESDTITFSIASGALPNGLSQNTSNGNITGTLNTSVGSATTYNFTVAATDPASNRVTRAYSIVVSPPPTGGTVTNATIGGQSFRIHTFTSDGQFVSAGGLSQVDALVVAGGGSAGARHAGGGGAGGVLHITGATINAGTYAADLGEGGGRSPDTQPGTSGQNTTFFGETANGGGRTNAYTGTCYTQNGGSGGGQSGRHCNQTGSATQGNPSQYSGTGYGNAGGTTNSTSRHFGGGGGGAGGAGQNASSNSMNDCQGGAGVQINIDGNNRYWAGGGGGNGYSNGQGGQAGNGGAGGGGGGGKSPNANVGSGGGQSLNSGGAGSGDQGGDAGGNTGGGGGGGSQEGPGRGGAGGRGIVIVKLPN